MGGGPDAGPGRTNTPGPRKAAILATDTRVSNNDLSPAEIAGCRAPTPAPHVTAGPPRRGIPDTRPAASAHPPQKGRRSNWHERSALGVVHPPSKARTTSPFACPDRASPHEMRPLSGCPGCFEIPVIFDPCADVRSIDFFLSPEPSPRNFFFPTISTCCGELSRRLLRGQAPRTIGTPARGAAWTRAVSLKTRD